LLFREERRGGEEKVGEQEERAWNLMNFGERIT
jgi:hypothetical protein